MRSCGTCTACCEGWLAASIKGEAMYPGSPCKYLSNKCTIYNQRPKDPCINYKCEWLKDDSIPEWMRPDRCKAILTLKEICNIRYVWLTECGEKLRSDVLAWLFMRYLQGVYENIVFNIHGHPRKIGTQEFIDAIGDKNENAI